MFRLRGTLRGADSNGGIDAVEDRHVDVGDDQVRRASGGDAAMELDQAFLAAWGGAQKMIRQMEAMKSKGGFPGM